MSEEKQALTLKDAAALVGVSERTIANWIGDKAGQIRHLPGTKLIRRADLVAYFDAHYRPTPATVTA